tara:strand:- start:1366 stop:2211 length:846 start_codon:yes stop_codon:yes gene_type:complete
MKLRIMTGVIIGFVTLAMIALGDTFLIAGLSIVGLVCTQELAVMMNRIWQTVAIANTPKFEAVHSTALEDKEYASRRKGLIHFLSITTCVILCTVLLTNSQYRIYIVVYSILSVISTLTRSHNAHKESLLAAINTSMVTLVLTCSGVISFYVLSQIHQWQLIYVIGLTAVSDIMGYFVGKKYGKVRIFPQISPNKTEYGTVAMLISPSLAGIILSISCGISFQPFWTAIGILGLIGDLWISSIKRLANLKDTGTLLPGHGGILDRIDSHILVLSVASYIFT